MSYLPVLNIVNGLSNFPVIYVIHTCYKSGDPTTAGFSLFAGLASLISHLGENHKHNLPGILGVTPQQSYLLNRLDVLGVSFMVARLLIIYYRRYGFSLEYFYINPNFILLLMIAISFNLLSERFLWIANNPLAFTVTHSTWHIMIFTLLNCFLARN